MAHPLLVLAHPAVMRTAPEELRDEFEERAAIREHMGGPGICYHAAERGAAREVLARYVHENRSWLP